MRFLPSDPFRHSAAILTIVGFTMVLPVLADERPEPTKTRTVIKATKYIDVDEAKPVLDLLGVPFAVKPDQNLIVLRGPDDAVETALKAIDALDEPRPSIDLHVFILAASEDQNSNIPKDLEAAVQQLQGLFGYTGFELLDNVFLKVREGRRGRVDGGIFLENGATERTGYQLSFQKVTVVPEDGRRSIRFKDMRFQVNGRVAGTLSAALVTDVEIREGQKAVVGSSTPQGIGQTLILIVHAEASPDPSWKTQ